MARTFSQIVGVALLAVGIVGFLLPGGLGPLHFTMEHNLIHVLSGVVLAYLGFKGTAGAQRTGAQVFGIIYGLVTLLGLAGMADPFGISLHLNAAYNVIHLVISAWALWAGFARKTVAATS